MQNVINSFSNPEVLRFRCLFLHLKKKSSVWTNFFLWWDDNLGKIYPLRANLLFLKIHIVCFSFKVLLFPKLWHKLNHLPVVTKLVSLFWLILLIDNSDGAAYLHLTGNLSLQLPTKYSTQHLLCHQMRFYRP